MPLNWKRDLQANATNRHETFSVKTIFLKPANLADHRDESVRVSVVDLESFFEPRDLVHVRRIENLGLEQSHPIVGRVAILLFDRREIALRSVDFLGDARDSLGAIME